MASNISFVDPTVKTELLLDYNKVIHIIQTEMSHVVLQ